MRFFFLFSACIWVLAGGSPLAGRSERRGTQIHVESESSFCSYLPPSSGQDVAATETQGVAFCTDTRLSPGSRLFPSGFIRSAHFEQEERFVQVTGRIDRTKYGLQATDGGGQYDHKDLPDGTCAGFAFWVNLVEPNSETFCIRCCHIKADCNVGISTAGCHHIIPGNYS